MCFWRSLKRLEVKIKFELNLKKIKDNSAIKRLLIKYAYRIHIDICTISLDNPFPNVR